MKKILLSIAISIVALFTASCGDSQPKKNPSQGAPYELYVVCSEPKWKSPLGDTLRAVLLEPVEMLNQKEPQFNVLRVNPQGYDGLILSHKNQLIIKTGAEYTEPSMTAQYDVYAAPQIIVTLSAPTEASLTEYVWANREQLLKIFLMAERDRAIATNKRFNEKNIGREIKKKFGFEMKVPTGYTIRNQKDNFMWISYELPQASLGVVIYSYPYTDKSDFTAEKLTVKRNEFTALVPGPVDGSFMTTSSEMAPEMSYQRINGRFWAEMKGFWDVEGDFMGGPFVSFSTLDTKTRRVVTLDCYLYSPKQNKRNYMKLLEHLIYTVEFPAEETDAKDDK